MSVLFFNTMRYKADDPRNQCNDRFVLSKVGRPVALPENIGQLACDVVINLALRTFLRSLGSRCTHPVCCMGRGRFREGV